MVRECIAGETAFNQKSESGEVAALPVSGEACLRQGRSQVGPFGRAVGDLCRRPWRLGGKEPAC